MFLAPVWDHSAELSFRFLLAQLHIDQIVRQRSPEAVEQALTKLPKKLDETYNLILKRINDQDGNDPALANRVLSWLTWIYLPLPSVTIDLPMPPAIYGLKNRTFTASMLRQALAIESQHTAFHPRAQVHVERLVEICAGLVSLDIEHDRIDFVHYSTQEYFHAARRTIFPNGLLDIMTTFLSLFSFEFTSEDSDI